MAWHRAEIMKRLPMPGAQDYEDLLQRGRQLYAPTRIGRPGTSRGYWWCHPPAQLLRLKYSVHVQGMECVEPGPAILVGNHLSLMDPIIVGMCARWRTIFFTKEEVFLQPGAVFFRLVGQIPLRRGDEAATKWALDISAAILQAGHKLCVYPEATRSPDRKSLHRLHRRILVPILQANPAVPVHAMSIGYAPLPMGRTKVDLRFSPALSLDPVSMSANELTDSVRDAIVALGGMPYVHQFGRAVKERT
jgi:1-acyl-sn-glycerol-3-phosphate acyltransferase